MNQSELISIVADETDFNKVEVAHVVAAVISAITHELAMGGDVRLTGFGSFKIAESQARTGRNPSSGEKIKIAASMHARFKEAVALKEALNPVRLTGAKRRA